MPFKHRPLTANQVAAVFDWIANPQVVVREETNSSGPKGSTYTRPGNGVCALAVLFAAHTGVRAAELQGLQVQGVTLSDIPGTVAGIRVVRTAARKDGQWTYGTPKSDASADRVVPLAAWLADELRDYLTTVHPLAGCTRTRRCFPVGGIAMSSIGLSRWAPRACTRSTSSPPARQ